MTSWVPQTHRFALILSSRLRVRRIRVRKTTVSPLVLHFFLLYHLFISHGNFCFCPGNPILCLTGADFAPLAQRTFGNVWGHWLLKLGGRAPHHCGETGGVSDVGGGGAASPVRLIAHYSPVCTVSSFSHQSCCLF